MVWLIIFLLLVVSFVFSGIEAGILSVNRVRLQHQVKLRDSTALRLKELLVSPERFLVTVLVVTNLMNILAIVLATDALAHWFGQRAYYVAFALFLPLNLFLLEVLPKSLFRRFPYRALAALAEPLRWADYLLTPMHFVGWRISTLLFGDRPPTQQKLFVAREDFKYFTAESERTGAITSIGRKMIHNVIDFRSVAARDVMIPMEKVPTASPGMRVEELLARSLENGVERWPVVDSQGAVTGLIDTFDLSLDGLRTDSVEPYQRRIVRVAPNEPAYAVLRKLRAARVSLAVVSTDPQSSLLGVVTTEDLIRRLVDTASAKGLNEPAEA